MDLFEMKTRMGRVLLEQSICLPSLSLDVGGQRREKFAEPSRGV
jgi:hypothetical protein